MSGSTAAGKQKVLVGDKGEDAIEIVVTLATSNVVVQKLQSTKQFNVFVNQASATDFVTAISYDVGDAIDAGTAAYGANVTQANVVTDGTLLGITPVGATAIKITNVRRAAATDDPAKVTAYGGRLKLRLVPVTGTPPAAAVFPSPLAPSVAFA